MGSIEIGSFHVFTSLRHRKTRPPIHSSSRQEPQRAYDHGQIAQPAPRGTTSVPEAGGVAGSHVGCGADLFRRDGIYLREAEVGAVKTVGLVNLGNPLVAGLGKRDIGTLETCQSSGS